MTLVGVATLVGAQQGFAECDPHGLAADTSGHDTLGQGNGTEFVEWNVVAATRTSPPVWTTYQWVSTQNLVTNRCLDSWFDWTTVFGHFDARLVRNCDDNEFYSDDPDGNGKFTENNDSTSRTLIGLQKGAGCTFNAATESFPEPNGCDQVGANTPNCVIGNNTVDQATVAASHRTWFISASGVTHLYSGGDTDSG